MLETFMILVNPKGLSGVHLIDIDEVDAGSNPLHVAPIKRKLFWKKKKEEKEVVKRSETSDEDTRFSDEELHAGRPKHFFKKKKQATMAVSLTNVFTRSP